MTKRNPIVAWLLAMITCGIFGIIWYFKSTDEMKARGADIPHPILILVPIVNFWFLWKFSEGVQKVSNGATSAGLVFILSLVGFGIIVAQGAFNNVD